MRKQLVKTISEAMEQDERLVLLLGDIGVYGFRHLSAKFPKRVYNIGICEQASVSLAAGLALEGMIPVFHTIAPFMVERAFEQIKIDFGYQELCGNFISVGASYDYAALGCTHHCPGDVAILKTIPNMEIFIPGHAAEFDKVFRQQYADGKPSYFRLSEKSNAEPRMLLMDTVRQGTKGQVLAIGPMLDVTLAACEGLDLTIFYSIHGAPFQCTGMKNLVVVEPCYEGSFAHEFSGLSIGVPRWFLTNYGTAAEHDEACGLTAPAIRAQIMEYFNL
jgi:transketolase